MAKSSESTEQSKSRSSPPLTIPVKNRRTSFIREILRRTSAGKCNSVCRGMQLNTTLGKALSLELLLVIGNVMVKIERSSPLPRLENFFTASYNVGIKASE
ncbi:Uncharacterised protein [Vibrio cholerae]|nr:Uncharacterised protein [Vibrio cholerae]